MHTLHVLHQTWFTVTKLSGTYKQRDDAISKKDTKKRTKQVNNHHVGFLLYGLHRALW